MRRIMPRPRRYRDIGVTVWRRDGDVQKTVKIRALTARLGDIHFCSSVNSPTMCVYCVHVLFKIIICVNCELGRTPRSAVGLPATVPASLLLTHLLSSLHTLDLLQCILEYHSTLMEGSQLQ